MHRFSWKIMLKITALGVLFLLIIKILDRSAKKDWHDWQALRIDCQRVGIGEQGRAATLGNKTDRAVEKTMFELHGLNALLSDVISVNRSVPDVREQGCLYKKYLNNLPTVGIVMAFYHEYLSTFARTLHSVINRTPPELLKEIILVDDFSDPDFFQRLKDYVIAHFDKVRFVRFPERMGLIRARLAGARMVTADVLVILDPHIEVNYNWLPPLLEPIALNKRTVVSPVIDGINAENLGYNGTSLTYGGFAWHLGYEFVEVPLDELKDKTEPYDNPIMLGCAFAISLDYFWELGGYDDGLEIWGGEQIELSLKVWMCGGKLLNAPCSRVAHHYRSNLNKGLNARNKHFLEKNKKRVVEVWFDEYKKYFYDRHGSFVEKLDVGDLTKQKALRKQLNCKPFKWFLTKFYDNIFKWIAPSELLEYTSGAIRSVAFPGLCIDTLDDTTPGLYDCIDFKFPKNLQMFTMGWRLDLRRNNSNKCLDVPIKFKNAPVILYPCHGKGGTQFWYYDRINKLLISGEYGSYCLEAFPNDRTLIVNTCVYDNVNMKWNFLAIDTFFYDIPT